MATVAAPSFFERTSVRLVPPKFGLLSVANLPTPEGPHWQSGIEYQPPVTPGASLSEIECLTAPAEPRSILDNGIPLEEAAAFRVWAGFSCKTVGLTQALVRERAQQKLLVSEGPFAENQIWVQSEDSEDIEGPYIMGPDTEVIGSAAASLDRAIGLLERELYTGYASTGVIHMPRELAAVADHLSVIRIDGNVMRTKLGTPVVFGNYPNLGAPATPPDEEDPWVPEAPAAGSLWIAATGDVTVLRGAVDTDTDNANAYIDATTNTFYGIAERPYVVAWDGFQIATLVDL